MKKLSLTQQLKNMKDYADGLVERNQKLEKELEQLQFKQTVLESYLRQPRLDQEKTVMNLAHVIMDLRLVLETRLK